MITIAGVHFQQVYISWSWAVSFTWWKRKKSTNLPKSFYLNIITCLSTVNIRTDLNKFSDLLWFFFIFHFNLNVFIVSHYTLSTALDLLNTMYILFISSSKYFRYKTRLFHFKCDKNIYYCSYQTWQIAIYEHINTINNIIDLWQNYR